MDLKEILERNSKFTLEDLQDFQREYDKRFVDKKFDTSFGKVEHTYAHMGKLLGRLASYVEAMEEGREASAEDIKSKVIPDLLVYATWLAKEFNVSLEQAYLIRVVGNLDRLYSGKISSQELEELENCVVKRFS